VPPRRQHLLGLVKDSRTTDLWYYLAQDGKMKTTMIISNRLVGLGENAFRVNDIIYLMLCGFYQNWLGLTEDNH
jgi:hypothetical protein